MTGKSPIVSIITISKDDPEGLAKTLASVSGQSFQAYEQILVLAGRSRDINVPADGRIHWTESESPGISNALNAGVAAATGEWIQFLNGGDAFSDDRSLELLTGARDASVAMICSYARVVQHGYNLPTRSLQPGRDEFIYISHQATLFRRDLFERYGLFSPDIKIRMDLEWLTRLPRETAFRFLETVTVDFDGSGVSSTHICTGTLEEARILAASQYGVARALRVLAKLPFRLFKSRIRAIG
ncbi:glycosyltransferase [Corticimicrobacter populi]|uniref:Glycosyltransferase 2-like domain-containing protein n=1 Tax=Corticimicrobacter populi TaxID=2175229 RepID=A0A2V1JZV3_9BURK|nr:glycosyltransferase [Corticimicrobacter populi]PWF22181.1 hypothetical protein DD235_12430 [Corticimicrobacter populi]